MSSMHLRTLSASWDLRRLRMMSRDFGGVIGRKEGVEGIRLRRIRRAG